MFIKTEPALHYETSPKNHQVPPDGKLFNCSSNDLEQYKCPSCPNVQTDFLTDIKQHIKENHLSPHQIHTVYRCTMCRFETYSKYLSIEHKNKCDKSRPKAKIRLTNNNGFECEYCLREYPTASTLTAHKKRYHATWFNCAHCPYKTKHKPFLVYHLKILHKPEFFTCGKCPYKARAKSSLQHHRILKHGLGQWLQCGHCTYKAVAKPRMLQHLKRHRAVSNPQYYLTDKNLTEWLNCEQCNFKTKSQTILGRHQMDKHSNLFNCEKHQIDMYECSCKNFKTHLLPQLFKHVAGGHKLQDFGQVQQYQCRNCLFHTHSQYLFVRHNLFKLCVLTKGEIKKLDKESDNETVEWFKCDQCQFMTKNKYYLRNHKKRHNKRFYCVHCTYKTSEKRTLRIHVGTMHSENLQWHKCDQCSFKTKFPGNLSKHIKIHSSNWIKCDLCFFKTKHVHNLNLHKMYKHDIGTRWFSCDFCIFQTKREYSLKLHKQSLHGIAMPGRRSAGKSLDCKKCPFKCQSRDELRAHQAVHDVKKHKCQYCDHSSKRGYNLKLHVVQKHSDKTEIQWLQCDQCDFRTKTKSILKRHVLERHSEEWVHCAQCPFKAKSKRLLINHIRAVHAKGKETLFQCAYCEYTAKQKSNLKKHAQRHERVKEERFD